MMQHKMLKIIIGIALICFVFFSILIGGLCRLSQNNSVATNPVVSNVSNTLPAPNPIQENTAPNPLSWEPVLHLLLQFFSKACPR